MNDQTPTPGAAPQAATDAPVFTIERIYVKDLSLENPSSPQSFLLQDSPQIEVALATRGEPVGDGIFESVLTVTVTAKVGEQTIFLVEVAQAGIFQIRNIPESDMQPILDGLSLTRRIPRTQDYGLLPAQKHATAALGLHLRSHRDALLVGEMSTGKTTVGTAVAALLNARRTLVLCPPHLVAKWKREVETVWSTCTAHILTTISEVQEIGRAHV